MNLSNFSIKRYFTVGVIALISGLGIAAPASADQEPFSTSIIPQTAPVLLTRCLSSHEYSYVQGATSAVNRSELFLVSYTVRWKIYDHTNNNVSQGDTTYDFKSDLAPGDSTAGSTQINLTSGIRFAEVGKVKCRLQNAKFEGGKTWLYGHPWRGRLRTVDNVSTNDAASEGNRAEGQTSNNALSSASSIADTRGNINLKVTNAWNDTVSGNLLVHVAIDVMARDQTTSITPSMLTLSMALANGSTKFYTAMQTGAPTYEKVNALNSTNSTAYEVDPKEDLGRLGSISISPRRTAHIVATFMVGSDTVSDSNDNRSVKLQ